MRQFSRLRFAVMVALLLVSASMPTRAAEITDLFGRWEGTWFVDEKFNSSGNPVGAPPYDSVFLLFEIHEFDGQQNGFGTVSFDNCPGCIPSGTIINIELSVDNQVLLDIEYLGNPLLTAAATGLFQEDMITGDYDEVVPPPSGFVTFRGPFQIQLVPEPTVLMFVTFLPFLFRRRFPRRRRCPPPPCSA